VASPSGDRNSCAPSCSRPYTGAAFRVHWVPRGVF
jgi:hypothetical protein